MNRTSRLDFWWPMTFGVTIGLELMLSAIVLFGPAPMKPEIVAQLTNQGRLFFVPERDVAIYALGCVVTVLLVAGFSRLWRWRRARISDDFHEVFIRQCCAHLSVAAALFLAQLGLLFAIQQWGTIERGTFPWFLVSVLIAPTVASLLVATIGASWNVGIAPRWLVRLLSAPPTLHELFPLLRTRAKFSRWFDVGMPLLVCAVLYVPEWRDFFKWYFSATNWCRAWCSFMVGPMLSFHHGQALGTEAYSQYGVGWPVVYSALSRWVPMAQEYFIQTAIVYGGLYFIGVYVFLRLAIGHAVWAASGVLLALSLQMFHGLWVHEFLWEWPSSTILRSPMDIWFFIALLFHLRTGRARWAVAIGVFVGLAVFFETDTGIHLTLTFVTYWAYWGFVIAMKHEPQRLMHPPLRQGLISFVSAVLVLLAGLAIAGRGTLLHAKFWTGWLEAILTYGAGMSMLPIANVPPGTLPLFSLFITIYLGTLGWTVIKVLRRESRPADVLLGCLAAYGSLTLILFVGRSETSKIFHPSVPFGLIMTILAAQWYRNFELAGAGESNGPRRAIRKRVTTLVPWCALGCSALWLAANPIFQHYPGALQTLFTGSPMRNVKGPQPEEDGYIPEFDATISMLRTHIAAGRTVAVLDDIDTVFYLAANAPPWWRFSPSFSLIIRKSELADLQRGIVTRGPEIILIRGNGEFARQWYYDEEDVWLAVHQTVQSCYRRDSVIGNFEFWRRNGT